MNEATPSKTSKVNILSDIVLNPLRTLPQNVNNLLTVPPLVPFSSLNKLGNKEIFITKVVSVNTPDPTSSNSNQILLTPNTNFATIQATEESLKRKSAGIFAHQETPKKPKLIALKDQVKNNGKAEETFFNYMTGNYEQLTKIQHSEKAECSEENANIKDEVTIQENSLQGEENETKTIHLTEYTKTEEVKQEESKDGIQMVTNPEIDLKLDDKKPTLTIDLTDDDETETNVNVQNNIFIQNVLALQNAIALQSVLKPESDAKIPLQQFFIQSPGNTVTNLQCNNVNINKSPSPMMMSTSNVIKPNDVHQPMVLVVQNNSPFLVPQNMVSANTMNHNNLQSNLVLVPNNLNFQTNLMVANKQPFEKHIIQSPKITSQKLLNRISPKSLVTENLGVNLVPITTAYNPLDRTSITTSKASRSVQPKKNSQSQSGVTLNVSPSKLVTNSSQNSTKNHIISQNFINSVNFSHNFQSSTQEIGNSLQDLPDSSINNSLQEFSSPSPPNSTSSVSNTASLQTIQTSTTFAQNLTNALQNFICQTCSHRARSKRDLILHIYHAHLKDEYELSLKCKVCNFETDIQSVMEKHDLEHGNVLKNQENVDNIPLSNNVEIRIRMDKKKYESISLKAPCNSTTNVPIDVIDLSDSDDDISKRKPIGVHKFRCFDCNFSCSRRRALQSHAAKHVPSKFQCPKHQYINDLCAECDYQKCLSVLEKTMFLCKKCEYRTCWKQCFDTHQCGNEKTSDANFEVNHTPTFKCFHCPHVTNSIDLLKDHAISHLGGAFACDIHQPQKSTLCDKCVYEKILKDLTHVVHSCPCGFKTLDKKMYSTHRARKVNCQEFKKRTGGGTTDTGNNGKLPVRTVNRISTSAKSRASSKKAASNVIRRDSDSEEGSENFECFHCNYSTTSRKQLKHHAVKHYDQIFECSLHPLQTSARCKKCMYKTLLKDLKEKLILCQYCGFRTLRQGYFTRHSKNPRNCETYRKKIINEAVEQPENESDSAIPTEENSSRTPKQKCLPSVINCAKCNYRAMDKETFKLHEKSHELIKEGNEQKQTLVGNTRLTCFDCNEFYAEDREKLKEHSVIHYKKKFSCDKHPTTQIDENCGKCLYYAIKKDMENEILICNSSREHKKTVQDNDDDDYIPDFDMSSELINSVKYNLRKRYTTVEDKGGNQISSGSVTTSKIPHNFECMDCSLSYVDQSELENHLKGAHQNSSFICDNHLNFNEFCKKCLYQYVLENTSKKSLLSCTCCGFKCDNIEAMQSHIINSNTECDSFGKILNSPRPSDEVTKEVYACYDCDQEFDSRIKLWNHASGHRSEFYCSDHPESSKKKCGKCLYAFISKTIRLYYFRCFDCSNTMFASELDLKDHVERQHSNGTFKCDIHLSSPGENCEPCQYAYMVAQKCQNRYYCADCRTRKFPYYTWKTLRNHVSNNHKNSTTQCSFHYNIKPYLECDKCFYEKVLKYVRFQDKAGGYQCFECPSKVFTKEQLEAHIRLFHEGSVFQCTTHSLGDIDEECGMCYYESLVVIMNNNSQ